MAGYIHFFSEKNSQKKTLHEGCAKQPVAEQPKVGVLTSEMTGMQTGFWEPGFPMFMVIPYIHIYIYTYYIYIHIHIHMYFIYIYIYMRIYNSLSMVVWPYPTWVYHPTLDHGTPAKIMPEWISQQNVQSWGIWFAQHVNASTRRWMEGWTHLQARI